MKKIVALAIALSVGSVWADGYREHRHVIREVRTEQFASADILFPLIFGGLVGAAIANQNQPQPVIVQSVPQQQVYIQREPVIVPQPQTVCYGWKEIQTYDGRIYRERTCYLR